MPMEIYLLRSNLQFRPHQWNTIIFKEMFLHLLNEFYLPNNADFDSIIPKGPVAEFVTCDPFY